jgi:hypothetical protein
MNLQFTRNFIAHGEALLDDVWVPVTVVGRCPKFSPNVVHCTVASDENTWVTSPKNFSHDVMELKVKTEGGKDIWVPIFKIRSFSSSGKQITWNGVARIFFEGDLNQFDAADGKVFCSAFIPPTPLAFMDSQYDISHDGTITLKKEERKGICWNTEIGQAQLIDYYDYHEESIGFDEALIRVQRCQIEIESQFTDPISLAEVLYSLNAILDEPLLLLSFLNRRYITWYAAQANFYPDEASPKEIRQAITHCQRMGYETQGQIHTSLWLHVPADAQALKDGLFQQLLMNLEGSPLRNVIHQTIPHLLKSREGGYFQGRLGSVYLALESLIDGLSEEGANTYLLNSSQFKRLSKKLSVLIKEEIAEQEVAEGIINKLAELRRRAFLDRLLFLFKKYHIDTTLDAVLDRLRHFNNYRLKYSSASDIVASLGDVLKRRNVHIHQGKLDSEHNDDLMLLQSLVELWLLNLLGCPDAAINPSAYSSSFYG